MRQKFRKLTFVHVADDLHSLFGDFDGIINGTYLQLYGNDDVDRNIKFYSIYELENGKVTGQKSWFNENQITELPNQDREKAEEMIENYLIQKGK